MDHLDMSGNDTEFGEIDMTHVTVRRSGSMGTSLSGLVAARVFGPAWEEEMDMIVATERGVRVDRGKEPDARVFYTYYHTARMYMDISELANAKLYVNKARSAMLTEMYRDPRPEASSDLLVMLFTCACIDLLEMRLRPRRQKYTLVRVRAWMERAESVLLDGPQGVVAEILRDCLLQLFKLRMEQSKII